MKKLIAALALLPSLAFATCTESTTANITTTTCTTGTESAPTLATEGRSLSNVRGIVVTAVTAGTMTAGGVLQAYTYGAYGQWVRSPDLDLVVSAVAAQNFQGLQVVSPRGRITWRPSGTGLATTIYVEVSN